jgi:hypothetical protein
MVYFREVQRLWAWVALLAIWFWLWAERVIPWNEVRSVCGFS